MLVPSAGGQVGEHGGGDGIRVGGDEQIDRRQALVIHAPAIVQDVVERDLDDLGAGKSVAGRAQRPGEIDPVEAEDDVGFGDGLGGVGHREDAGAGDVQRMVGGEGGADLEVGDDAGAEGFGEGETRSPRRPRCG